MSNETKDECNRALILLASLERHTLNGRHMCANNVVIDLLFNMRISLERLKVRLQARGTEFGNETRPQFTGSSSGGNGGRHDIDMVPLSSVEALMGEYRQALLSARERVSQLEQDLAAETDKSAQLRARLTEFFQFQADSREPQINVAGSTSRSPRIRTASDSKEVEKGAARLRVSEASALAQLGMSELDQDIERLKSDLRKSADRRTKELLLAHLDALLPFREES